MRTVLLDARGLSTSFYVEVSDEEYDTIKRLSANGWVLCDTKEGRDLVDKLFARPRAKGPEIVLYYI